MTNQLAENLTGNPVSEEDILRQIEQAILDHRLPPGTKLKEVQLTEVFGAKRGMIRKVLTRLANSRLVVQTPNRGASVAKPSAVEGRELFATRRAIEGAIVETLAKKSNDTLIRQLKNLLEKEHEAYQLGDSKRALALSVDFHRQLAILAGNSVMQEFLDDIIRRTPLVILTHIGSESENRCRNQEHEQIVEAIAKGDASTAIKIMNEHLLHIENQISDEPDTQRPDLASLLMAEQK